MRCRLVVGLLAILACPALVRGQGILCTGVSPEGVTVTLRLDSPTSGGIVTTAPPCSGTALVEGAATAGDHLPPFDLYLIVDSSGSTGRCSGLDVDRDGTLGVASADTCSDAGDSVLSSELTALGGLVDSLAGLDVRVAIIEFSAILPNPRPADQGRIRVVQPLTPDLTLAHDGLTAVLAAGPRGATDYAGALDAAIGELRASGDPTRASLAFFLTDGKPTFPRYPWDSTETPDIDAALDAAQRAAAAGLAINTYEVGSFDDRGILTQIASLTGGQSSSSLDPDALLASLPATQLTGIESVVVVNDTTGESVLADLRPDGTFSASVALATDYNVLHVVVTPVGGTPFDLDCSASVLQECIEEGTCFRETTESIIQDLLASSEQLARQVGTTSACAALRAPPSASPCAGAVREYIALVMNALDGRLTRHCLIDDGSGTPRTVDDVLAEVRALIESGTDADCAAAERIAEGANTGATVTREPLPPPTDVECIATDPATGLDVTITITSPVLGEETARAPCDGRVPVTGTTRVTGMANLFDLFFVIDSSGSTSGASGRDIDGDGFLGTGGAYNNTDPGDSVLEAEIEAVREFVAALDPAWARVAIIQFSTPEGFFGNGERQRIVQPLTDDFSLVEAGLQQVSAGGSSGATDYGGALGLLDQEYTAHADPANRVPICFFLSDGIPTFPDPPYDETQPADRQAAIDGATLAATHGIQINTYEVGPAGADAILTEMSDLTGGTFYSAIVAGDIVQVLTSFNLVRIASVTIENVTTGESSSGTLEDDGSFSGTIGLEPGDNAVRITVITDSGTPITASCETNVELVYANLLCEPLNAATWAGTCHRVTPPPTTTPPEFGSDDPSDGVAITLEGGPIDGHRVYRGSLDLLDGGTYAHVSPFTTDPLQPECMLPVAISRFVDAGALHDGNNWYYLVVDVTAGVEDSFGQADRDGDGIGETERPRPEDDPGDLVVNSCP